jgi:hypothetical protein
MSLLRAEARARRIRVKIEEAWLHARGGSHERRIEKTVSARRAFAGAVGTDYGRDPKIAMRAAARLRRDRRRRLGRCSSSAAMDTRRVRRSECGSHERRRAPAHPTRSAKRCDAQPAQRPMPQAARVDANLLWQTQHRHSASPCPRSRDRRRELRTRATQGALGSPPQRRRQARNHWRARTSRRRAKGSTNASADCVSGLALHLPIVDPSLWRKPADTMS